MDFFLSEAIYLSLRELSTDSRNFFNREIGDFHRDRVLAVATALVTSLRNLLPEMRKGDNLFVRKIPGSVIGETFNESEHLHFLDFLLAAAKEKTEKSPI